MAAHHDKYNELEERIVGYGVMTRLLKLTEEALLCNDYEMAEDASNTLALLAEKYQEYTVMLQMHPVTVKVLGDAIKTFGLKKQFRVFFLVSSCLDMLRKLKLGREDAVFLRDEKVLAVAKEKMTHPEAPKLLKSRGAALMKYCLDVHGVE